MLRKFACFDIGSGMTKMQIAAVRDGVIKELIETKTRSLLLRKDLSLSGEKQVLSEEMLGQCRDTLKEFLDVCSKHNVESQNIHAYATEVFRIAKNGQQFLTEVKDSLGLSIVMAEQSLEAKIGFNTAIAYLQLQQESVKSPENLLVWDSGAGSFQITNQDGPVAMGKLGSAVATEFLSKIKKISISDDMNPVSQEQYSELVDTISTFLKFTVTFDKPTVENKQLVAIGDYASAFAVLHDVLVKLKGKDYNDNRITLDELTTAVSVCVEKESTFFAEKEVIQPEMVLPKLAIMESLLKLLGYAEFRFMRATGGCLGYLRLVTQNDS